MSRSFNTKNCGRHCGVCKRPDLVKYRESKAPTADEQLAGMCNCPACRVGCEDRCWASIEIPQDVLLPDAWCAACGSYYCDGVGAPAFCEVR